MSVNKITSKDVVDYALSRGLSLRRAAEELASQSDKKALNLWRRAQDYVLLTPNGRELFHLFLRQGAANDVRMAAYLVCDVDESLSVIVKGNMPLHDACDHMRDNRKVYQLFYNRIMRHYPDKIAFLRQQELATSERFFTVRHNELGEVRR